MNFGDTAVANALTALNTLLLVINLLIVVYGVKRTIDYNRFNRTWSYIERLNSESMLESKLAVDKFVRHLNSLRREERKDYIDAFLRSDKPEDERLRERISIFCNIFTELGVAHYAGAVDKRALISPARMVVEYWEKLSPLIERRRAQVAPQQIHTCWERLRNHILKEKLHTTNYAED